jgi:hypothetical protein
MGFAIYELQKAILDPNQSLTQLLRQTKLIASKLNLQDVEQWVDCELRGYPENIYPPSYRIATTMYLEVHNPVRGWQFAGNVEIPIPMAKSITEIENLSRDELAVTVLPDQIPVRNSLGQVSNRPQRLILAGAQFKTIVEAVRDELLQWTVKLEKKGVKGEAMNFDEKEKQLATNVHIEKFTGVFGNVTNSHVAVNDYSSICKLLIEQNVPTKERRELEDILEEFKTAPSEKKKGLIAKAESWMVKHGDTLGTGAEIVGKFIKGLSSHDSPTQLH